MYYELLEMCFVCLRFCSTMDPSPKYSRNFKTLCIYSSGSREGGGGCAPCAPPQTKNFLNFMQFFHKFGKFVSWHPLLGVGGGGWGMGVAPPPTDNPGSAPDLVNPTLS